MILPAMLVESLKKGTHCFKDGQIYCPSTSEYMGAYSTHISSNNRVKLLRYCSVCGQRILGLGEKISRDVQIVEMEEKRK